MNLPDDVVQFHALFTIFNYLRCVHSTRWECSVVVWGQVEVLETERGIGRIIPGNLEVRLQLFDETDTST